MDFFLDDIAHWVSDNERLNDEDYKPWRENEFRNFLENKCLLNKENPIKGRIITNHNEAFFFWDELIQLSKLKKPFAVTHIDAHSDTGLGDAGYVYIMKDLINYPIEERRGILDIQKVQMGNYLSYALACGWIKNVEFVLHSLWDNDILEMHVKNFDTKENFFQFKAYDRKIDVGLALPAIVDGRIKPISTDNEIPFKLTPWKNFETTKKFDYLVFCQSPGYTPKSADYMLDIIKEYIIEI
jgi:UPF0489 domain